MMAPSGGGIDEMVKQADAQMKALPGVEGHAEYGLAGEELSAFSGEVDLLIVGSRNYGPARRLMVGSTSHHLTRHARGPLLVLPRGSAQASAARGGPERRAGGSASRPERSEPGRRRCRIGRRCPRRARARWQPTVSIATVAAMNAQDAGQPPESPSGEDTIRIVLADDHQVVRSGLRLLLDGEEGLEVVAEASDVEARPPLRPRPPSGASWSST